MKIIALVVSTVRELIARVTLIVLAAISTIILLGVAAALSVTTTPDGSMLTVFGNPLPPAVPADQLETIVASMQAGLAGGLFFGVILFGVFATAGVIPDTLERGIIDIYLSKPIPRWQLLLGRSLGAVAAIFLNILYFIGTLWLISGLKLGVWNPGFLLAAPTMTFTFLCLYAIVVLTGVASRTSAIAIIAAFLYLVVIGSALYHREQGLYLLSENSVYRGIIDALYYAFPQVSDLQDAVARGIMHQPVEWRPYVQSICSSAAIFAGSAFLFRRRDF